MKIEQGARGEEKKTRRALTLLSLLSKKTVRHERRPLHLLPLVFPADGLGRAHGRVQARRRLLRGRQRRVHRVQEEGQGPDGVPGGGRRGDVVRRRPVSSFGSVPIFAYHRDAVSVRLLSSGWELMGSEMSSERGPARWALVDC